MEDDLSEAQGSASTPQGKVPKDKALTVAQSAPLCAIHGLLENRGHLDLVYGNGCVACSLAERVELLDILATCADTSKDSVTALREMIERYRSLEELREMVGMYCERLPAEIREALHKVPDIEKTHVHTSAGRGGSEVSTERSLQPQPEESSDL